jgi:putative membrane protein
MSILRRTITMTGLTLLAAPVIALQAQVTAPGTNPQSPTSNPPSTTNPAPTANPTPTSTATPGKTGEAELRNDLPFLREAAGANLMEVTLGRVAQSRGSDTRVRDFGGRMVTDHSNLQQQLTTFTTKYGIGFTPGLSTQQQQDVNRLQSLSGSQFDREYITMMVQNHQNDVDKFENQSRDADSPRVRELAMQSLPVLQQHLSMAQRVAQLINVPVATTPTNPSSGQTASADVKADAKFIREVAADNMLEIQMAQLAEQKAQSSSVKQFAERIISDHQRMQSDWTSMASGSGYSFKPGIGKNHRSKLNKLQKLSGREFDRAFITQVVQDRKDYIDYFEKEGRAAHSAQVRQLVNRDVATLRTHFTQGKRIGAQVGADVNVSLRSETSSK